MKTCNDYLDACKAKLGLNSDYQLCKIFGWSSGKIGNYRKNRSSFDVHASIQVAELLEISPEEIIAAASFERAKDDSERAIWERVYDKLMGFSQIGKAAGIAAIIGIAATSAPQNANANLASESPRIYIMSSKRTRCRRTTLAEILFPKMSFNIFE